MSYEVQVQERGLFGAFASNKYPSYTDALAAVLDYAVASGGNLISRGENEWFLIPAGQRMQVLKIIEESREQEQFKHPEVIAHTSLSPASEGDNFRELLQGAGLLEEES